MKLDWPSEWCIHNLPPPMPRRSFPQKPRRHSAANARPANPCRALVPVNGAAIRKKIHKHYEKARRDLDAARRQLDQFNQTDRPQFSQWMNRHCGALLTELRELGQKRAADEQLVMEVEDEAMFGDGSYARAYQRVMHRRANPEPPPPPPGADERGRERDDFGPRPKSNDGDGEDDPLAELFKELFGEFGPGDEWQEARGPRPGSRRRSAPSAPASGRLKELYRAVVRLLHPDHQGEMTPQKTEWWHQAQAAYEAGDADQLEVILTLCEIADGGATAQTSASLLQRITAQLKSSLREIKRQITVGRRDPAWNFSQRADHEALLAQVRRELAAELEHLRRAWQQMQKLIAGWQAAAARLKPPGRRKRPPTELEFQF